MAKKILLADDSITIQKVISITFASEDYELIIVGDGDSAINRAKEARPDLILADVAMPGKNGYEVCEAIKNDPELSSTPVLLLAGTFEPLNRTEAERVGADDSIIKPFESQELLNKVAGLIEKAAERGAVSAPQEPAKAPPAQEEWGKGDFIGFPEELEEKPPIGEPAKLPDLDFLDNGGLFEEPEKELPTTEDFTDLDFSEEEFGRGAHEESGAGVEDLEAAPEPSWKTEPIEPEPAPGPVEQAPEPVEPEAAPTEPEAAPVEPEAPPPTEEPRPFWAENVSRDEDFGVEPKEAPVEQGDFPRDFPDDFPDVFEEPEAPAEEPEPARPAEEPEAPAEAEPEARTEAEPESAQAPLEPERFEPYVPEAEQAPGLAPEPAPEPAPVVEEAPSIAAAVPSVAEEVEEAVAEEAASRLQPIEVPREELEEAVRKAVREVVEEIAWEVVPELAEELIRAEIDKVKEALTRLK